MQNLQTKLQQGITQLNLSLPAADQQKLIEYIELLHLWNQTYNLTAIRALEDMVTKHLLDSLSIVPYLQGKAILDVGSGAGLPGIPLAVYHADKHFVLIDSCAKKIRFLTQAQQRLQLSNLTLVHTRVEDFAAKSGFDTIISRAFAAMPEMVVKVEHLCVKQGVILAMTGLYPQAEIEAVQAMGWRVRVERLQVPYLQAQRHVVSMTGVTHD